jgi:hypothetical protein
LLRQLNSISRKKTITMHDPIDHNGSALSQPTEQQSHQNSQSGPAEPAPAAKPQQDRLQTLEAGSPSVAIRFQYKGTERTTELPLNLDMIGRLAWEAEFRNMSTAELIGELIMGMVKKDLCVATLFLLIFGALWHQTLMLARRDRSANLN